MWLLVASAALAAPERYLCASGDSMWDIVGIARSSGLPSVTIQVSADCKMEPTVDDADYLSFSAGEVLEYIIEPEVAGDTYTLPPIRLSGGVTVNVEGAVFQETTTTMAIRSVGREYVDFTPGAVAYVEESTLTLTDTELIGGSEGGIVVMDGTLEATGLIARGFSRMRPLYIIGDTAAASVTLTDSTLSDNGSALFLYGVGADVIASLTRTEFADNGPVFGADIAGIDVTSITVTDSSFTRSDGGDASDFGDGAPVFTTGGSITCNDCTFTGTAGDTASAISAYLNAGDALTVSGGRFAPSNSDDPVFWLDGGGELRVDLAEFRGAGELVRYGGNTRLTSTRFYGEGAVMASSAVKLSATTATLNGVTLCGYSGASAGLVAAYGSDVTVVDSIAHGLTLGSAGVVNAADGSGAVALTLLDNTIIGTDGAFVTGNPVSFVAENNLVVSTSEGISLSEAPDSQTIGYNLWFDVDDPVVGGAPVATDIVGSDPGFLESFIDGNCETSPWLSGLSPANGGGDPGRPDIYGFVPSDIGALDYDDDDAPLDTGGSGDTDDTGVSGDTGGSGDTDDTGFGTPVRVGGALGSCGCGTGGGAALLLLPLLVLRRRRA